MTWIGLLPDANGPRLQRAQERQRERAQGVSLGDRGGKPLDSVSWAAVQGMGFMTITIVHIQFEGSNWI